MKKTYTYILLLITLVLYTLMAYGGVRAPDSEIVIRAGESLERGQGLVVGSALESWYGFGVAKGKDGRIYSIFGPLESIASVPFIRLAKYINKTGWYKNFRLPMSHYASNGLGVRLFNYKPKLLEPHATRFIVSFLNIFISTASVLVFAALIRKIVISDLTVVFTSLLYGFGSLVWPYSGTLFSEPLATLLVLFSLYLLILEDPVFGCYKPSFCRVLFAGISLGLATSAHITAVLFLPFFAFYCGHSHFSLTKKHTSFFTYAAVFISGFSVLALLLGYYNFARFGSFVETGRTVSALDAVRFGYGRFVAPWHALYALLFSAGKGAFVYCPVFILGILSWYYFYKKHSSLSITILAAVLFRVFFIASRSDWHGGSSLGPRYLVMLIPCVLIPVACAFDKYLKDKNIPVLVLFFVSGFACVVQQVYLCIGELFTYNILLAQSYFSKGIDIFENDRIYMDWNIAPIVRFLNLKRGPFLLQDVPLGNMELWGYISLLLFLLFAAFLFCVSLPSKSYSRAFRVRNTHSS